MKKNKKIQAHIYSFGENSLSPLLDLLEKGYKIIDKTVIKGGVVLFILEIDESKIKKCKSLM